MERMRFVILLSILFTVCNTSLFSEICDYTSIAGEVLYITSESNVLFVSIRDKGLVKSTNNGVCWTDEKLSALSVYSITTHKGMMYAATSDGIYKKVNGEWQKNAFSDTTVRYIIANSNVLFAITYNGMYRSTDEGKEWNESEQWVGAGSESKIIVHNEKFYACSNKGAFCSSDDGNTWQKLGAFEKNITCLSYDSGLLYAGTSFEGVYAYDLVLQQWQLISPEKCEINTILVKADTILVGGNGCSARISSDKGKTWQTGNSWQFALVYTVCRMNNTFFIGSNTGLHIYDVGKKQFMPLYERMGDIEYITSAENTLFLVQDNESFRSSGCDFPSELMPVYINPKNQVSGSEIKTIITHNNAIFAVTDSSIIKSEDDGKNWTKQGGVLNHIYGIHIHKNILFTYTSFGLYRSNDWGITNEIIPFFAIDNRPSEIESNDTVIIVHSSKGVYTSYDGGDTWQIEPELQHCENMVLTENLLFMSDGNYLIRYNMITKEKIFLNANNIIFNSRIYQVGDLLFVTGDGLRYSNDKGATWRTVDLTGIDLAGQSASFITQCGQYVYFAFGKTLVRKNIADFILSSVEPETQSLRSILLSPNPTSDEIAIRNLESVTIPLSYSVTNSVGEKVISGIIPFGSDRYTIPIRNLPIGMYIFTTEINGKRVQEKFVVIH